MLKELYLIPVAIYIFSYIPLLFKKEKKMYKLFLSLIYTGFAVQTLIFFIFLSVKGLTVPVHIDRVAKGLRGKRAAIFSVAGFLLILFSLSFSFYLFPSFHGFE